MPESRPSTFRYDTEIDLRHESTHTMVLDLVGLDRRVLELGCGTGHMSKVLKARGCQVVGVEVDPEAAKYAAEQCDHVVVGDLEQLDLDVELGDRRFDVIIAADVLEHLKEPEAALVALRPFLAPGGYLVASVPNVGHASVRLALLGGSFEYTETGLLDRTHLRFYTRPSLMEMLANGEFAPVHVDTMEVPVDGTEVAFDRDSVSAELVDLVTRQPDALVYQFVVVAFPARPPLEAIPTLLARLNRERQELRNRVGELLVDRHELETLRPELEAARTELQARSEQLVTARGERVAMDEAIHNLGETLRATSDELARTAEELAVTVELSSRRHEEIERLQAEWDATAVSLHAARHAQSQAEARLQEIYRSKLWRLASRYRRAVQRLRREQGAGKALVGGRRRTARGANGQVGHGRPPQPRSG